MIIDGTKNIEIFIFLFNEQTDHWEPNFYKGTVVTKNCFPVARFASLNWLLTWDFEAGESPWREADTCGDESPQGQIQRGPSGTGTMLEPTWRRSDQRWPHGSDWPMSLHSEMIRYEYKPEDKNKLIIIKLEKMVKTF